MKKLTKTEILESLSNKASSYLARGDKKAAKQIALIAIETSRGVPQAKAWREILEQYL